MFVDKEVDDQLGETGAVRDNEHGMQEILVQFKLTSCHINTEQNSFRCNFCKS